MVAPWDRRPPAEQERVAGLVLRSWLPAVAAASPFWQRHLAAAGVDPDTVRSVTDLRRIPPVRGRQLADAGGPGGPDLVLRPEEDQVKATAPASTLLRIAAAIRRGGVDGKRLTLLEEFAPLVVWGVEPDGALTVASTRSDLDRLHRTGARAAQLLGLDWRDTLLSLVPPAPTLLYWGVVHLALATTMLRVGSEQPDDPHAAAAATRLAPVTVVAVPPARAVRAAAELSEAGAALGRVRTIVLVGPPPDEEQRQRITDAWATVVGSAPVVRSLWAPAAARGLWAECHQGTTGLHTYPDLGVVETLDPVSGQPASGGDLTVTSLGWHGTALIRFRTGHHVRELTTDPCPACGRTVPRVVGVEESAWQPRVTTADGAAHLDLRGLAEVLAHQPEVRAWRVELRGPTGRVRHDRIIVEVAGEVDSARLAAALTDAGGVSPTSIVVVPDPADVEAAARRAGSVFADLR